MTDTELEKMLRDDGWPVERLDDTTWRSGFQSGNERFRFFIRLVKDWLYLTIIPFAQLPAEQTLELAMLRRLLVLNREITLAKFALDKRDVVLTVELATEGLSWTHLKDALDALTFYASKHHAEVTGFAPSNN